MSYLIVEELRLHDGLLRSTTLCFILIAFCSACSQRTTKERSYNEKDLTHYDQIYSAKATFDRADYLPLNDIDTGYISGYYLSYRYKLQVHHIWKGSPEDIEYEYRCGVGDIKYYKPQLSEQDWNQIKKYSRKSPEVKLIYSLQRIEDTVMNECVEMKDYDESFTNRLQLV